MSFFTDDSAIPKLCGIFIFSFTSVVIGLLPMAVHSHYKRKPTPDTDAKSQRRRKYKRLLAQLSSFGGGVLLSTTFLHLLPEIRKGIEDLRRTKALEYEESIQLPELLMCLGFLFLYFMEEVAHTIMSGRTEVEMGRGCVERFVSDTCNRSTEMSVDVLETNGDSLYRAAGSTASEACVKRIEPKPVDGGATDLGRNHGERHPCHNESMIFFTESSGRSFLLIFALSIHEGFEGLAIGLERQPDAVWYMVLGVGSHKAVIAFCIGVQMLSSKLDRKVSIVYVFMFATATSFGVAIGMFLSMESGLFAVILQGLATGTLLHVVFFELLKPHSENTPFTGVFLGFVSMALLKYFFP